MLQDLPSGWILHAPWVSTVFRVLQEVPTRHGIVTCSRLRHPPLTTPAAALVIHILPIQISHLLTVATEDLPWGQLVPLPIPHLNCRSTRQVAPLSINIPLPTRTSTIPPHHPRTPRRSTPPPKGTRTVLKSLSLPRVKKETLKDRTQKL